MAQASAWISATHVGDQDGVPGPSCCGPFGSEPAVEDACSTPFLSAFQIKH